ncbi:tetratricopeptide repeat protein [Bradyrhizobium sp. Tv2a-2]|uniref:tetratricopeptide repeat protein n=1 Tax=Bradyrhizobium sp. Tv2a-2 TaxID=113395 RepID=UPI0004181837|nr:tetratricopeptide repeat protein [Bradyrhizobium sp. Tv2a-2]
MSKDKPEDIVRRAAAAFNEGRIDEARKLCEQGLVRTPREPMLSHLLAAMLLAQRDTTTARFHIENSLNVRPDNAAARMLAGRITRAAGDFQAALVHFGRAIALSPQREAFVEHARTLDQAGLRAPAREAWAAILKVIPEHQEAASRLGRLAFEDGDLADAASYLERATAAEAPASTWFDLGVVRQDMRNYAAAETAYRKVLDIKPDHAEAALNLGIVLQESGDPDAAMGAYATAYRLRPDMFGAITMALTSAPHGRLWLDEAELRRALA